MSSTAYDAAQPPAHNAIRNTIKQTISQIIKAYGRGQHKTLSVLKNQSGSPTTTDKSGKSYVVNYGLDFPNAPKLVGWKTVTVTPDMIGKKIAVFVAAEPIDPNERISTKITGFLQAVIQAGGIAGTFRDVETFKAIFGLTRF